MELFETVVFVLCLLTVGFSQKVSSIECKPLTECPQILSLVRFKKYDPSTIQFLKKSHCGYSKTSGPLIWCPIEEVVTPKSDECITSNGKKGACKEFNNCGTILNTFLIQQDIDACANPRGSIDIPMKICCHESQQFRSFDINKPEGYINKVILHEDSNLQEVTEPIQSVKSLNKNFDSDSGQNKGRHAKGVFQHRFSFVTEKPIKNIWSNNRDTLSSKNSQRNRKEPIALTYRDFLNNVNKMSESDDNVHFDLILNRTKREIRSNGTGNLEPVVFKKEVLSEPVLNQSSNGTDSNELNNIPKKESRSGKIFFLEGPRRYFNRPPQPFHHSWGPVPYRPVYENNDVEVFSEPEALNRRTDVSFEPRNNFFACGREARRYRNRIIGGIPIALGEYPWMVLIQYKGNDGIKNGCGGSLINSNYFITAAHCVDKTILRTRKMTIHRVILGEYDTNSDPDCVNRPQSRVCAEPSRIYGISSITKHPKFDDVNALNDIAIVKLDKEVVFSEYIKPICLPTEDFGSFPRESVLVAGWGKTETGETYSQTLNKALLPVVDREECNKQGVTLIDGQVCLGLGNGVDTCTGDSGGPIMIQRWRNSELVTYQFGIISYGFGSDCGKAPSVNTLLPFYLDWLYKTIEDEEK